MIDRDTLRRAGRAGRVDDVGELLDRRGPLLIREPGGRHRADLALGGVDKNRLHVECAELFAKRRHRNDRLHARILQDETDPLIGKAGVERNIGGVDLQHREQGDVGAHRLVEQKTDPVARAEALRDQESRHLVGAIVDVAKRIDRVIGDHCVARAAARGVQLVAALFEQMVKPLAFFPANRIVRSFANQH